MAFGTTPLSTTTLGTNQFPTTAVYIQGTSGGNFTALQGGPASSADVSGNVSAPMAIYIPDGNDVTLGTTTDTSSASTAIGILKAIKANTASVVIGSGAVTANQGGSWTVQANAGTNLNTSALALDTSVNGVILAQASTTSGQKGPLIQGAVTTGSPSYTTAQTSPISLTTAGAVRVDASATVQPVSGAFWQTTQPVSGTVMANAGTGSFTVAQATGSNLHAVLDSGSTTAVTQATGTNLHTVVDSGTITANIGTTNGLALDATVGKLNVAQAAALGSNTGPMMQGSVTTNAPTYVTGNINPLSLDVSGLLRASLKDTPSNTNNFNVNLAASAATVTVTAANLQTNVAQIGGTNVVTGGASGLIAVGGPVASGASNADNPVKQGAVFNTAQPTVTSGQVVDLQATARGAQIVATGADTFNATINAALPAGGNTIGAVTQASGPWTSNITQFGGNNVATGTGAGGAGIPRVTVSNDSNVLATQSGTWTVQPGNTPNSTAWLVQNVVGTTGGSTPYHNVVSSGTNGTNVKASAGQVYDGSISNTSGSAVYFRFYDTASAPTVGTTTTKRTIQVPGNGTVIFSWPNGLKFTSGIAWGITTAIADNDTTAIGAAVSIDFGYN